MAISHVLEQWEARVDIRHGSRWDLVRQHSWHNVGGSGYECLFFFFFFFHLFNFFYFNILDFHANDPSLTSPINIIFS